MEKNEIPRKMGKIIWEKLSSKPLFLNSNIISWIGKLAMNTSILLQMKRVLDIIKLLGWNKHVKML